MSKLTIDFGHGNKDKMKAFAEWLVDIGEQYFYDDLEIEDKKDLITTTKPGIYSTIIPWNKTPHPADYYIRME